MAITINASTSSGLIQSADNSGIIQFQSNGSTKATLSSSGFSYPGAVLQVVSVANKQTTSTTGTSYVASTIAASITPTSSSSKILVIGHTYVRTSAVGLTTVCTIYRGATDLTSGSYGLSLAYGGSTGLEIAIPFSYLDSPATTSSTTYTIYFKRADSAGTSTCGSANTDSVITLMEIAA